jgi:hypothetical protein
MMLIMFSLYRVSDNKPAGFCSPVCLTGHSGREKNRTLAVPQICGAAAVVRSNFRLSDSEPCVYGLCR